MAEENSNFTIHSSWSELIPRKNPDYIEPTDESLEEYIQRVTKTFQNIPNGVLQQWLFLHMSNPHMIKNYAWIDYHEVIFTEVSWTKEQISQIQIYSKFRYYVDCRSKIDKFSDFVCTPKDKDYWMKYGTWRVPIVVLKTHTIKNEPEHSELNRPYQLIEGHSRIGYFNAFSRLNQNGLVDMAQLHKIFLMEFI